MSSLLDCAARLYLTLTVVLLTTVLLFSCGRIGFGVSEGSDADVVAPIERDSSVIADAALPDAVLVNPASQEDCPNNYTFRLTSCYLYVEEHITWLDAEVACESHAVGSHLVTIDSMPELVFADGFVPASNFHRWVGATDRDSLGGFFLVTGPKMMVAPWAQSEPDTSPGCVLMENTGEFDSADCEATEGYICEFDGIEVNVLGS